MKWLAATITAIGIVTGSCRPAETPVHLRVVNGDVDRGRDLVERIGCGVCHAVPGVRGPRGRVGPSLDRFGARAFIAGTVPNRPDSLIRFIRNAPSVNVDTAMPELPLTEQEARDVAAFLYTLR
jgi:cytochrome c